MKNNLLKIFLPVLSAAALISCGTVAATSSNGGTSPVVDPNTTSSTPSVVEENTVHGLYAFEAATGLPLISELASPPVSSLSPRLRAADETLVNEIKNYLPTVEGALLEEQELITAVEEVSDRSEYATKITVTYTDITLANEAFSMYFNETVINDIDDDDDDDWDDRYENDTETETRIDGVVVFGENEYVIRGEKEIEGNESEVKFIYQMSETTYVQIQQEKELGESEFEYTVYESGRKVYDYSLEVDFDDRDRKVEMEVRDNATLTDLEMEFTLIERDGTTYIKADIENNGVQSDILFQKVVDEAGNATYNVISNE